MCPFENVECIEEYYHYTIYEIIEKYNFYSYG
jgi:hypothetical protein